MKGRSHGSATPSQQALRSSCPSGMRSLKRLASWLRSRQGRRSDSRSDRGGRARRGAERASRGASRWPCPDDGAFHRGHVSLMSRAREECGFVVVSLFVNPAQFNEAADLARYPRDEGGDAALAGNAGVDVLFAPDASEVYPAGFATTVEVTGITEPLEGAVRGTGHC